MPSLQLRLTAFTPIPATSGPWSSDAPRAREAGAPRRFGEGGEEEKEAGRRAVPTVLGSRGRAPGVACGAGWP